MGYIIQPTIFFLEIAFFLNPALAPPIAVESPQGLAGRAGWRAEATLGAHVPPHRLPANTKDLQRKAGQAPPSTKIKL